MIEAKRLLRLQCLPCERLARRSTSVHAARLLWSLPAVTTPVY